MRPHIRLLLRLLAVAIAGALVGVIWLKTFDRQGGQPAGGGSACRCRGRAARPES